MSWADKRLHWDLNPDDPVPAPMPLATTTWLTTGRHSLVPLSLPSAIRSNLITQYALHTWQKASHLFALLFILIYYFFFGCAGSSLLHGLFSSCREWGLLSSCVRASRCGGFSCCRAPVVGQKGFSSCGAQALEHRLTNYGAWA